MEFDVQLSRDRVPVIYHDFHVFVTIFKKYGSTLDLTAVPDDGRFRFWREFEFIPYSRRRVIAHAQVGREGFAFVTVAHAQIDSWRGQADAQGQLVEQ